jgi:hypothetical protein
MQQFADRVATNLLIALQQFAGLSSGSAALQQFAGVAAADVAAQHVLI